MNTSLQLLVDKHIKIRNKELYVSVNDTHFFRHLCSVILQDLKWIFQFQDSGQWQAGHIGQNKFFDLQL